MNSETRVQAVNDAWKEWHAADKEHDYLRAELLKFRLGIAMTRDYLEKNHLYKAEVHFTVAEGAYQIIPSYVRIAFRDRQINKEQKEAILSYRKLRAPLLKKLEDQVRGCALQRIATSSDK